VLEDGVSSESLERNILNNNAAFFSTEVQISGKGNILSAVIYICSSATYIYIDLSTIWISAFDADDQSTHPNFNASHHMKIRITKVPSKGELFQNVGPYFNLIKVGDEVTAQILSSQSNFSYGVKYRPLLNQHSNSLSEIYDTFSFEAIDSSLQYASAYGTISIIVKVCVLFLLFMT
jgi:hypothetical protein